MRIVLRGGYLTVGRVRGAPVRVHWSWPLAALLFTRGIDPFAWAAFAVITLVHELGHAFLVRRYRLRVRSIDLHGLGGQCRYEGEATPVERSIIAWGGVVAQALVLLPIGLALARIALPPALAPFTAALVWSNVYVMALNLLPIAPFDGAEAWRLFGRTWHAHRELRDHLDARDAARAEEDAIRARIRARAATSAAKREAELPADVARQLDAAMKRGLERARDGTK